MLQISNDIKNKSHDADSLLKKAIWLYFLLVFFEGALRKWFLPGLASPLLLARDPIALWLVVICAMRGYFKLNIYIIGFVVIGMISLFATIFWGHGNIMVALYGARILLIHFPCIFAIAHIFTKEDVIKFGKFTAWLAIPMALLIAIQFYSPQSAFVNRGVGGDTAGAGFTGALGYFRPSGTFSFTNGNSMFFSFAACFVFYFWIKSEGLNKIIIIGSTIALLVSIPLSISRSLFFHIIISFIFVLACTLRSPKYISQTIISCIAGIMILFVLSKISFFQTATEAFTTRFESANRNEGGLESVLLDRYLGGLLGALSMPENSPFFGQGLGMGTNVGSMLLAGERRFLVAEGEWGRLIGESGIFLGMILIILRLTLSYKITARSWQQTGYGNFLPWMLLSFCILALPQGGLSQPTALGFLTMISGLNLAALNETEVREDNATPIIQERKKYLFV